MFRAVSLSLLLLAACGADGAPQPPAGITVEGTAQVSVGSR